MSSAHDWPITAADRAAAASTGNPRRVREVLDKLQLIVDPCSAASVAPMSIVEMGLIRAIVLDHAGRVGIFMRLTSPGCLMMAYMAREADRFVGELDWAAEVTMHPDDGLDWDPTLIDPVAQQRRHERFAMLELTPRECVNTDGG